MRESNTWKFLNNNLPPYIAAERFEAVSPPGVSDVFWTNKVTSISGWLELKYCEADDRELRRGGIPKLKPEQPMFLRRQAENNVPAGILLRAGRMHMWYYWRAESSREWVERVRSDSALSYANAVWDWDQFSTNELFRFICLPL
jgi:hypothetical protein